MLSNMYLTTLDSALEDKGYRFIRFGDDINIYVQQETEAAEAMEYVKVSLNELGLKFNKKKNVLLVQRVRNEKENYQKWHKSVVQKIDRNYHLVNDGILTKQDYTILFENESGKKYLPVETIDSINSYSNIIYTSNFFEFVGQRKLKIAMYDKYGNYVGAFVGKDHGSSGKTMMKQAAIY